MERSKHMSSIRFLPYTNDLPTAVVEVNTALAHAENEEKRWKLFLRLLAVYSHKRSLKLGEKLFGLMALWKRNEPLVILMETNGLSLHQGQFVAVEIIGDSVLTTGYYLKLIQGHYAVALQTHMRGHPHKIA